MLVELAARDVAAGGLWQSDPRLWSRYDQPWQGGERGAAQLVGTIQVAYGTPTRYEITVYRVTVTRRGTDLGWTVTSLCDEALGFGGIDLAILGLGPNGHLGFNEPPCGPNERTRVVTLTPESLASNAASA